MSIIKVDYGTVGGGGIDLSNASVIYQGSLALNSQQTLTVTSKPKYIISTFGVRYSTGANNYVIKTIIQDVENQKYQILSFVDGSYTNSLENGQFNEIISVTNSQVVYKRLDSTNTNSYSYQIYAIY